MGELNIIHLYIPSKLVVVWLHTEIDKTNKTLYFVNLGYKI
jgi:hypothetical protein